MNKNLLYLYLFALIGCGLEDNKPSTVFFAGEIVNPTNDYVVLKKDDIVIDSAQLDGSNRFSFKLNSIEEGLYYFDHNPEIQYVYLEKGDSLMIRLNTIDFDESLVFSGVGEEINNFFIELFLATEQETPLVGSYYRLEPNVFSDKIDSLRSLKVALLSELNLDVDLSDKAIEMAQASIDYNYYLYKEKYPFYHRKRTSENSIHDLSQDFYAYRSNLNYDNKYLTYFRPYYKFMQYHIGNLSYMSCSHKCGVMGSVIKNQLHFNQHKLALIDSLVTEKNLRDNLFRNVALDYLLTAHDNEENNMVFINEFHKRSGSNKHINEIDDLYEGVKNMQPDRKIPDLEVYNVDNERLSLQDIAKDKKVVFYFWTGTEKRQFENIVRRVSDLKSKNLDYSFVGINFNTDSVRWQSMLEASQLDKTLQYRADDFKKLTNALIVYPPNKVVITKDAIIVDGFANLYSSF